MHLEVACPASVFVTVCAANPLVVPRGVAASVVEWLRRVHSAVKPLENQDLQCRLKRSACTPDTHTYAHTYAHTHSSDTHTRICTHLKINKLISAFDLCGASGQVAPQIHSICSASHSKAPTTHQCNPLNNATHSAVSPTQQRYPLTSVTHSPVPSTHQCHPLTSATHSPVPPTHQCHPLNNATHSPVPPTHT